MGMIIADLIDKHNAMRPYDRLTHLLILDASDEAAWWPEHKRLWVFDGRGGETSLNVGDDWALSDPAADCAGGACRL